MEGPAPKPTNRCTSPPRRWSTIGPRRFTTGRQSAVATPGTVLPYQARLWVGVPAAQVCRRVWRRRGAARPRRHRDQPRPYQRGRRRCRCSPGVRPRPPSTRPAAPYGGEAARLEPPMICAGAARPAPGRQITCQPPAPVRKRHPTRRRRRGQMRQTTARPCVVGTRPPRSDIQTRCQRGRSQSRHRRRGRMARRSLRHCAGNR